MTNDNFAEQFEPYTQVPRTKNKFSSSAPPNTYFFCKLGLCKDVHAWSFVVCPKQQKQFLGVTIHESYQCINLKTLMYFHSFQTLHCISYDQAKTKIPNLQCSILNYVVVIITPYWSRVYGKGNWNIRIMVFGIVKLETHHSHAN